jgi:hypothetical protein
VGCMRGGGGLVLECAASGALPAEWASSAG